MANTGFRVWDRTKQNVLLDALNAYKPRKSWEREVVQELAGVLGVITGRPRDGKPTGIPVGRPRAVITDAGISVRLGFLGLVREATCECGEPKTNGRCSSCQEIEKRVGGRRG